MPAALHACLPASLQVCTSQLSETRFETPVRFSSVNPTDPFSAEWCHVCYLLLGHLVGFVNPNTQHYTDADDHYVTNACPVLPEIMALASHSVLH